MLRKYGNLVSDLLKNVMDGKTDVSLSDCVGIAGNGIVLMLIIAILLLIAVGVFFLPIKGYGMFLGNTKKTINDLLISDDSDSEKVKMLCKVLIYKKIAFWAAFIILYIPVCIPTILYLVSLLCH